jgi:hypothetical protein
VGFLSSSRPSLLLLPLVNCRLLLVEFSGFIVPPSTSTGHDARHGFYLISYDHANMSYLPNGPSLLLIDVLPLATCEMSY